MRLLLLFLALAAALPVLIAQNNDEKSPPCARRPPNNPPRNTSRTCEVILPYAMDTQEEGRAICQSYWPVDVKDVYAKYASSHSYQIHCEVSTFFACRPGDHLIFDKCYMPLNDTHRRESAARKCARRNMRLPGLYGPQHNSHLASLAAWFGMQQIWTAYDGSGQPTDGAAPGTRVEFDKRLNRDGKRAALVWDNTDLIYEDANNPTAWATFRTRASFSHGLPPGIVERATEQHTAEALCEEDATMVVTANVIRDWCNAIDEQFGNPTLFLDGKCLMPTSQLFRVNFSSVPELNKHCNAMSGVYSGNVSVINSTEKARNVSDVLDKVGGGLRLAGRPAAPATAREQCSTNQRDTSQWNYVDKKGNIVEAVNASLWAEGAPENECTTLPEGSSSLLLLDGRLQDASMLRPAPILCEYGATTFDNFLESGCDSSRCSADATCTDNEYSGTGERKGQGYTCKCKEGEKDWSADYNLPAGQVCRVCAGRHFDIVFIVDTSGSMQMDSVNRIREFMIKFTQSLGGEDVRFAISQNPRSRHCKIPLKAHVDDCQEYFSFAKTYHYTMNFSECVRNQTCINDKIQNEVVLTRGTSCHGLMLNLSYHHFFGEGYEPPEKREKVMIFFTDGMTNCVRYTSEYNSTENKWHYVRNKDQETNDQVDEIARDIRRHGVRTIFMGVGPQVNLAHIRRMAGNARDGQHIAAFEDMSNEKILDEFRSRVCDEM